MRPNHHQSLYQSIHKLVRNLTDAIIHAAEQAIPVQKKRTMKTVPYWNEDCNKLGHPRHAESPEEDGEEEGPWRLYPIQGKEGGSATYNQTKSEGILALLLRNYQHQHQQHRMEDDEDDGGHEGYEGHPDHLRKN